MMFILLCAVDYNILEGVIVAIFVSEVMAEDIVIQEVDDSAEKL